MDRRGDHGGKSASASVVDYHHEDSTPTQAEIAVRPHQLWVEQGRRPGSADENWLRAERELKADATSRHDQAGSVRR